MSLVKALRHGQVTIPKKFREALNIKEGDVLEAELEGKKIVLTPKVLLDKKQRAWEKLSKLLDEVHEEIRQAGITPEEAERDALEMVRRTREKEYAKAKPPS